MAMTCARYVIAVALAAAATYGVYVLACSEGRPSVVFVNPVYPEGAARYAQGELGIVQPTFARWYLVEAYRRLNGWARASDPLEFSEQPRSDDSETSEGWLEAREAVLQTGRRIAPYSFERTRRRQFSWIDNCGSDALRVASSTLSARVAQFGDASVEVKEWLDAQDAVFKNCGNGSDAAAMPAAATTSNALIRADRAYQTACAFFYAMQYDTAAERFQQIGADQRSPWRKYGRYLSARAYIRKATMAADEDKQTAAAAFDAAARTLRGVLDDATLREMHPAAKGLLGFVAVHQRPMQRLHELSGLLSEPGDIAWQDLRDYTWLMDRFIGNTVDYQYDSLENLDQLSHDDELTDWILTLQGKGGQALVHGIEKWQAVRSTPWLIAVLWKLPATHTEADRVLAAAADVRRESPGFLTVAFLRVRLLAWMNRRDEARRLMADLPSRASADVPQGAINLLTAERLMLAPSFEAFASAIARLPIGEYQSAYGPSEPVPPAPPPTAVPSLDRDAAILLTERMPLDRLADLAESPRIPMRLRVRIAAAAWVRAVLLRRDAVGLRAAGVLTSIPNLAAALRAYVTAQNPEDRHYAGILAITRAPGLAAFVGESDEAGYAAHSADADVVPNSSEGWWWCSFKRSDYTGRSSAYQGYGPSVFPEILYKDKLPAFPEFLTVQEQSDTNAEFEQLVASGTAPNYLADEAVAWAKARPHDEAAAEALALAIVGTRRGCSDDSTGSHSQRAFATLHKLFPNTRWARQTKYWYKGRW